MATERPAGKPVLIVEDNEVERVGLATILRREGYAVATAADGASALTLLRAGTDPCLILLDMLLPGKDGWDFLTERKRDPELAAVPVIITTALGVASPEWAHSLGAAACFRKPFQVPALLDEVRRHCTA
jgi:sigma-B regulation protein RsbU (phosphoserine phosphatase)